ncbi:golgin subfamily A member 6-like protein 24 isoform X1 [Rhopilema esculentum]|uniref:golgin subfamily A member 6-like protein 24 isoform X1 n=1 Tax=Rhopilema esculentum TaxID=499914 RepID=UPI0031E3B28E
MAGVGKHDSSSLRNILEDFIEVHKNDMLELTSGHLNESKLWNPTQTSRESWVSAKQPAIRLKAPSKLQSQTIGQGFLPPIDVNKRHMTEAVMDFMLGPSGGVSLSERPKNTTPVSPTPEPSFIDKEKRIPCDYYFTQELELPELMLPVYKKQGRYKGEPRYRLKHEFIKTHHSLPTKSGQFKKMKEFQDKIIRKSDVQERRIVSGEKEISAIEQKLRKRLFDLETRHIIKKVPSFYGLQAYSDSWKELIDCSEIYGSVLRMIKDEYDAYISVLLDLQETQNGSLSDQLNLLSYGSAEMAQKVREEHEKVEELERKAMETLQENERLRAELKEEEKSKDRLKFKIPVDRSKKAQRDTPIGEKKKDLEEQVEELHRQIEQQMETLASLKEDRKENYVPVIVCQRMEQCIKETEIEIQKILKQNSFLENNIENLEAELEHILEEQGTNERDTRMLWMKINSSKVLDSKD